MKKPEKETVIERDMSVVKSNVLIQKTRHALNVQEQKIMLYLISKIKLGDTGLTKYTFDIKDFCKVVGIDYDNGKNYQNIKLTIKNLADRSFWITLDSGTETLLRWIERPYINKGEGIIKIKMDELMMPYLIGLKEHFTQYSLYYILAMKSSYSIRLYELLKSYQNCFKWTFSIDDLKKKLDAVHYERYPDFRRYALEPALKEIDKYTDLDIKYELIKKGRAYDKITFFIGKKKNSTEIIENVQLVFKECLPWERY